MPHLFWLACQITLRRRLSLMLVVLMGLCGLNAQELQLFVIDEKSEPLVGVQVFTTAKTFVELTDELGRVTLKDLSQDDFVNFSYLGYASRTIPYSQLVKRSSRSIRLQPAIKQLEEVVVIGRRNDQPQAIPYQTELLDKRDIRLTNPPTSAEVLGDLGGAYVQKSQLGGGSPILRGFEANRVLLVVDGVRMNNAIYRSGHLQNAVTIDPSALERVELIYGPGSLHYGSDALGGVIHFRTKQPTFYRGKKGTTKLSGSAYLRYATASSTPAVHLDANVGGRKWAALTSASYQSFGDLRAGSRRPEAFPNFGENPLRIVRIDGQDRIVGNKDPDLQGPNGYQQYDFMQKLRFRLTPRLDLTANFQFSNSSNIPRYDRLTELRQGLPRFAEWYYGPQRRGLASLQARIGGSGSLFHRATIIAATQDIQENRYQRRRDSHWRENSLVSLQAHTLTADFDKLLNKRGAQRIRYGIDLGQNDVQSSAFSTRMDTHQLGDTLASRYPSGGSTLLSAGVYFDCQQRVQDSLLTFTGGLRYSFSTLKTSFGENGPIAWPATYYTGLTNNNQALTWSLGATLRTNNGWRARWLAATAFRAPNLDDFAKFREKNGFINIPNPALRPERALSMEISVEKSGGNRESVHYRAGFTAYLTRLNQAISRQNFHLPNGATSLSVNGENLSVQANVNGEKATIYGLATQFQAYAPGGWTLNASLHKTTGHRHFSRPADPIFASPALDTLLPQDHIPPIYGRLSLGLMRRTWSVQAILRFNGAKLPEAYAVSELSYSPDHGWIAHREGTADNIEYGTRSLNKPTVAGDQYGGVYAWSTWTIHSTIDIWEEKIQLQLSVENLFDLHYRQFASGVSAPGRNAILALRLNW